MNTLDSIKEGLKRLEGPSFQSISCYDSKDVREALENMRIFLLNIDTCDFETGQKVLFMRLQLEALYNQMRPFLDKLEHLEKEK